MPTVPACGAEGMLAPPRQTRPHLEKATRASYSRLVGIRVVLADDQYLVREGIRRLLESSDEVEITAVCDDLDSLLAAVDAEHA